MSDCTEEVFLTDDQGKELEIEEGGDNEVQASYGCDLDDGHAGLHLAHIQSYGLTSQTLWLQWDTGRAAEFVRGQLCPEGTGAAVDDAPFCILWEGHEGDHRMWGRKET